ncbi:hypothetical protein F5148DRAFT_982325 [Russula earlei]|uniref:Uncharacterized protein n=1 Tax=Russula earlei TaxID=71964 RepID=A0ACC0U537_9AGAM|nr:hypothetical protein F5148DRAFT_982325 [Russula earlei]
MDGQPKPYITWKPIWETKTLFGWSTFGYVCHNIEWNELVYFKDYWRTDFPGIEKEGDIYHNLQEAKVRYIPRLGPAGNMLLTPEHPLDIQSTRTQDYVKDGNRKRIWCPGTLRIKRYVHYQLVLNTLGQPLSTFGSTQELCQVIRDAMITHTDTYNKAKILHQDASAGNILITPDRSGLLIDWDLSKKVFFFFLSEFVFRCA